MMLIVGQDIKHLMAKKVDGGTKRCVFDIVFAIFVHSVNWALK